MPFMGEGERPEIRHHKTCVHDTLSYFGYVQNILPLPSLAGNVLFINLNVICAIQIISATLLVISISELKNIEPPPLVHM